jgi:hypothetical protein
MFLSNKKKSFNNEPMEYMKGCVGHDGSWRMINKYLATMNYASEKGKWMFESEGWS